VSRARLCILDEACCHLDPAVEQAAERAFRERGGTLLVVAHRLGSAARADRVLLLDGTRTRLGTYAEVVGSAPAPDPSTRHSGPVVELPREPMSPCVVTAGRAGGDGRVGLVH
jgi:ABC-type protease/lipase transport system fused ATPase/permease subunit